MDFRCLSKLDETGLHEILDTVNQKMSDSKISPGYEPT